MADEGLKIVIGADLGDSVQKIAQLTAGVTTLSGAVGAAGGISTALSKIPAALRPINPAGVVALSNAVKQLKTDVAGIKTLPPIVPTSTAPALAGLKSGSNQATQALTDLGRVAQDVPFGFIGIQNNIQPLFDSFARLKSETGSTGGALRALASSLGGVGGIGLGISLITSAVTFASIGFDRWTGSMKKTGEEAKKTKDEVSAIATAVGTATADAAKVQILASTLANVNNSLGDRKRALEELKNTNEKYFGDLKIEDGLYGKLSTQVANYTNALILSNVQKARGEDLTKATIEEQDVRNQISDLDALISKRTQLARARIADIKARGLSDLSGKQSAIDILRNDQIQADAILKRNELYEKLGETTNKVGKLSLQYESAIQSSLTLPSIANEKKKKEDEDYLKKQIDNLEAYGKAVGFTSEQFAKLTALRVQLVTRDKGKLGLDASQLAAEITNIRASNELLEQRKSKLDSVAKSIGLLQGEKIEALNLDVQIALNDQATGKLDLSQAQRTIDAAAQAANLRVPLTLALEGNVQDRIRATIGALPTPSLDIRANLISTDLPAQVAAINTSLATNTIPLKADIVIDGRKAIANIEGIVSQLNRTIANVQVDAFASIGEAIGAALTGGDMQSIFGGFISILANGLKEIGKAIIAYGIASDALKKAIKNPYVAIAAGIGLVAAGAALQSTLSQRKFAQGGVVTGPTNALIGEAGPEVVFPLNKLNSVIKGMTTGNSTNGGAIEVFGRLSGPDIYLSGQRAAKQQGGTFNL